MELEKRIRIKTTMPDGANGDYRAGEEGWIDGYVRGGDERPYAVVVFDDGRFAMVAIHALEATKK